MAGVKRAISIGVFGGGVVPRWLLDPGDRQGPVLLVLGALLAGMGVVGCLFPAKMSVLDTRSGPE